jgi:hypothetical protein
MSYYNTTQENQAQLTIYDDMAKKQEDVILNIYRKRIPMSPSIVHGITTHLGHEWPLTSVRRAITNLTKQGMLSRTEEKQVGIYNRPEFKWVVNYSAL